MKKKKRYWIVSYVGLRKESSTLQQGQVSGYTHNNLFLNERECMYSIAKEENLDSVSIVNIVELNKKDYHQWIKKEN